VAHERAKTASGHLYRRFTKDTKLPGRLRNGQVGLLLSYP
jgi:hypothetical protein